MFANLPPVTRALLIANRGEVAVRVLRAAAGLGLRTVAVFSEDDADCLHVRLADQAQRLRGTGPAAYLDIEHLLLLLRRRLLLRARGQSATPVQGRSPVATPTRSVIMTIRRRRPLRARTSIWRAGAGDGSFRLCRGVGRRARANVLA
ncbi:MAG: hypothetical protein KY442_10395, partial [Proteobacteria bacterium]|nr:hypothetical protein [Pseudomonadota bacterium]